MQNYKRAHWVILLLFILSIAPPTAAWLVYRHGGTPHTVQHGQLQQPAPNLEALSLNKFAGSKINLQQLQRRWLLVYAASGSQPQDVLLSQFYKLRQLHLALGKNRQRVQPLVILWSKHHQAYLADLAKNDYKNLLFTYTTAKTWQQLTKQTITAEGAIYIIDPISNLILSYPANSAAKSLYQDLSRLLEASRVG